MHIEFENSFLYFYSTIPQVLGALVALLGVFLLFKIQSLNKSITSFGEQISRRLESESFLNSLDSRHLRLMKASLKEGIMRQDIETIVSQVSGINTRLKEINEENNFIDDDNLVVHYEKNGIINQFKILEKIQWDCLNFKDKLIQDAKSLLFQTIVIILVSVLCLPFIHLFLSTNNFLALSILTAFVFIWFSICLIKLVWLIIISLSHDYNDGKKPNKKGIFNELKK